MSVSLMVLCFNRLNLIRQTIECIKNTTEPHNLIIVDNHGDKEVTEYVKELEQTYSSPNLLSLNVFYNKENRGVSAGRNRGLNMANQLNTEYFVTIDPDILFHETAVTECKEILTHNKNYGAIGVNFEGTVYPTVQIGSHTFQNKPQGNLGSAFAMFPKWAFKTIGFFKVEKDKQNQILKYSCDDADYYARIRAIHPSIQLGYLSKPGIHLGGNEDPNDPYRKWKNEQYSVAVPKFREACPQYYNRQKNIYIPYSD